MFTPNLGRRFPIWLVFFRWVDTTNQTSFRGVTAYHTGGFLNPSCHWFDTSKEQILADATDEPKPSNLPEAFPGGFPLVSFVVEALQRRFVSWCWGKVLDGVLLLLLLLLLFQWCHPKGERYKDIKSIKIVLLLFEVFFSGVSSFGGVFYGS